MTKSGFTLMVFRTTVLGALLVGFATLAVAQKPKPPVGPPLTTKGTVQSAPKAPKGQEMAEGNRAEARERKAAKTADKRQNGEQRLALKIARSEPKALLQGITLTPAEKKSMKAVEKRYSCELTDTAAFGTR